MPSKQEMHLYEYAVIRLVPRVEREEFFNIGIIMMCKRAKWIKCRIEISRDKLKVFASHIDTDLLSRHLDFVTRLAEGDLNLGQLAMLPVEERFRWLTAVKSSCIQTSPVHPGLSTDLEITFDHLFDELIL